MADEVAVPVPGPEVVPLQYAGFWIRVAATIVDMIVLVIGVVILGLAFTYLLVSAGRDLAAVILLAMVAIVVVIGWLYYAWFESSGYMGTPGKIVCGIKVTDLEGNRIGFGRATLRYLFKDGISILVRLVNDYLSCITLCYMIVDTLAILANDKKQSIHDLIAGTVVVYR